MDSKTEGIDIHKREWRLRRQKDLLKESAISKGNKQLIREYIQHKKVSQDISTLREVKLLSTLRIMAEAWDEPLSTLKPEKRADEEITKARKRIEKLLGRLYTKEFQVKNQKRKKPSNNTRRDYYILLRSFYAWMIGKRNPEEFDMIQIPKAPSKKVEPEDLLTWEDVENLSKAAQNPRDALMPQILMESGGRVEEIGSLTLRDVEVMNDGEYAVLHITKSKRDRQGEEATRPVSVVDCVPSLLKWLAVHPRRGDKNAPLLVTQNGKVEAMQYAAIRRAIIKLGIRAGIKKKANPHTYRKSATSYLRNKKKMSDAAIKTRHGWKQESRMLNIYAAEDNKQANEDYLQSKGMHNGEKPEEDKVKKRVCRFCGKVNPIDAHVCSVCLRLLKREEAMMKDAVDVKIDRLWEKYHAQQKAEFETGFRKFVKSEMGA